MHIQTRLRVFLHDVDIMCERCNSAFVTHCVTPQSQGLKAVHAERRNDLAQFALRRERNQQTLRAKHRGIRHAHGAHEERNAVFGAEG